MPTIPNPPVDASGGIVVLKYTNGRDTHRARLHVRPFASTLATTGPAAGSYPYVTPPTGSTPSPDPLTDGLRYAAAASQFYDSSWHFTIDALYQMQAGSLVELFGWTAPAFVAGVSTSSPTESERAGELIMNCRTAAGNRARFILVGTNSSVNTVPFIVVATYATTSNANVGLLNAVGGPNSGIVGHDGSAISNTARLTFPYNRRLRRHYGQA